MVNRRKEQKESEELTIEQVRLIKARADKLEIEIGETTKTLVPIKTVEKVWTEVISSAKKRLLAMPQSIAPEICLMSDPAEIEELISSKISEILNDLSKGVHF